MEVILKIWQLLPMKVFLSWESFEVEKGEPEVVTSFLSDWDFHVYDSFKFSPHRTKFPMKKENTVTKEESEQATEMKVLVPNQVQSKQLLNTEEENAKKLMNLSSNNVQRTLCTVPKQQ